MYKQCLAHQDSVHRIMSWEVADCMRRHWCDSLEAVGSQVVCSNLQLLLVELILGELYGVGLKTGSPDPESPVPHSINERLKAW